MYLKDFDYHLPKELIAQYPLNKRDDAKLLIVDRTRGVIEHSVFSEIDKFLPKNSALVLNNSKVIHARLIGKRENSGGKVEVFLLKKLPDGLSYQALIRPLRRLRLNEKIIFDEEKDFCAQLVDVEQKIVRFDRKDISSDLALVGHVPLPPYIKRSDEPLDKEFYQTIYAKKEGAVASPTAGLHFTQDLINSLEGNGHTFNEVTLHINFATFNPVKEENVSDHKMHCESFEVDAEQWNAICSARESGRSIISVGTTACRVLESVAINEQQQGETDIFITPGYSFKMTDGLITNFHLPKSTLLMLVYAFGSSELIKRAYQEAVENKYRFYSYGDAMLII